MMVYIVKLHHDTETLLSSKTVPKLRGGLAIILLVVIMTAAQGQVISNIYGSKQLKPLFPCLR